MQQQTVREANWEQDRQRQEERWKRIQHQFTQLQQEVQSERRERQQPLEGADPRTLLRSTVEQPVPQPLLPVLDSLEASVAAQSSSLARFPGWKGPKMQPYHEDEDIEHYLTTFERIASACQWPQEEWALHLAPILSGKARAAYVAMDREETMDYAKVKSAVLEKFEIRAETYRMRFRSTTVEADETPKELQTRLKDLYDKWMVPKKTKEQIGDAIVMEQFLRVLNPDLPTWVKELYPTTSKEAAEMAEAFLATRRPLKSYITPRPSPAPPSSAKTEGGNGHRFRNSKQGSPSTTSSRVREFKHRGPSVCHSCGRTGHFMAECPGQQCQLTAPGRKGDRAPLITMPVIDTPFSRIAMDIVGSLERSSAEIITDQGFNFTSNFLREVYKLLGIRGVKTSPYHPQTDGLDSSDPQQRIRGVKTSPYLPQTDGLVERFNKTLKSC
ncbi:uncharacterized protein LOC144538139 [Centroberyx gerrardi]